MRSSTECWHHDKENAEGFSKKLNKLINIEGGDSLWAKPLALLFLPPGNAATLFLLENAARERLFAHSLVHGPTVPEGAVEKLDALYIAEVLCQACGLPSASH